MPYADFVHLRVHTAYSLSEGAIKIPALVDLCKREAMPAVAVTDSGNLFGALEFAMAAAAAGVQPIIGCQMPVVRGTEASTGGSARGNGHVVRADALVLLVQNETGYRNLSRLTSRAYLESETGEPRVTLAMVKECAEGLIALSGGVDGAVGRLLADGQMQRARGVLEELRDAFPGRFYVELTRHGLDVERRIESDLIDLACDYELPLVATNDVHFATEDQHEAHDALLCIAQGVNIGESNRRRLTPDHRFRTAAEMKALFADVPEAIANTLVIARRCAYMPTARKPILPQFPTEAGFSEADALGAAAKAGLEARLARHVWKPDMDEPRREEAAKPYRERLEYELGVIIKMGFAGYFLIVADFIQWAKRQGIPVGPGRGSGAGSVVAWSLLITDLDPLRFGLLFERFLNPDRVSMPDFDIDFCQDRRDEVIRYVQDKYGADRVAQIITFGKLQARAALRDVGRVLGMPYGQVDKISKLVPFNPAHPPTLQEALDSEPQLRQMRDGDETVARLIDISLELEGLYRHASTHAAGVVIGDRPLTELIPLYRDPRSSMAATQFSMKYTELAGLVKFDFLGLKTLTVLRHAVELIRKRVADIDLATLPLDDRPTYEMLGRGDSTGVFQLESGGMRDALRQMKPDCFGDIIALVALYRPGPMDNIPRYIACKHGRERPDYLHPMLERILKETFGVIIYQEQVMQIAQVLSGFSLASADLLRRAMGKKIKAEMEAQREAFVSGAVARGVDRGKAAQIFDQVDKFAGYGFNKSHAAAYALVAYQTAYLKANYPVEFFAASMTLELGNVDKLNMFRQELRRLDIPLLPPDINRSGVTFDVETVRNGSERQAIRYALGAIRNVGTQAMAEVVEERGRGGPFGSAIDFAERAGAKAVNRRQVEQLIAAGVFDSVGPNRRQLFESVETLIRIAAAATNERDSKQTSLFGDTGPAPRATVALADVPDWPKMERLRREFAATGSYLSAHPLDAYGPRLKRLGVRPRQAFTSGSAKLAGVVIQKQERTSAKGNRFAFVQLSDAAGEFEITVFSEVLAAAREILEPGNALLVTVEARADEEDVRMTTQAIEPLDAALERTTAGLHVRFGSNEALARLKPALQALGPGRASITLFVGLDSGREAEIALPGRYALTTDAVAALAAIPGVGAVQEI
jgi:DNA polymerase-3 subunit alpha